MPPKADLTGERFGSLVVIREKGRQNGKVTWETICDCSATVVVPTGSLRSGNTSKCRQCADRQSGAARATHGRSKGSRAYQAWINMKARCNPATKKDQWQKDYVGRGIYISPSWSTFEAFLADMGEPANGMSLDRIDNDGPYSPENCRWANRVQQRHNSRASRWVTVNGERLVLAEAIRKHSPVPPGIVRARLHRGWPVLDAILTPKCTRWNRRKSR